MLVIDASVAVKFVFREPGSGEARALLASDDPLVAPDWILPEVAHALWNKVRNSELLAVHAESSVESLPEFFVRLFSAADLISDAVSLSYRLRHPVYDCLYLALAMRENAPIVTADVKFHKAMTGAKLVDSRLLASEG